MSKRKVLELAGGREKVMIGIGNLGGVVGLRVDGKGRPGQAIRLYWFTGSLTLRSRRQVSSDAKREGSGRSGAVGNLILDPSLFPRQGPPVDNARLCACLSAGPPIHVNLGNPCSSSVPRFLCRVRPALHARALGMQPWRAGMFYRYGVLDLWW